ncbi:MAG: alpha/beta hydrolase [Deltaproteobacteria bacterium]|nr:alpha/beta hydrolase [Deltaproteobacteria bacterium]MBW2084584.1 alpha/beta hydrolase [Deltaproteobacteria bacterium]
MTTNNSSPFDPEAVAPETAKFNERLEKILAAAPPTYTMAPQEIRDLREAGKSVWGPIKRLDEAEDRVVPGPAGEVPIRVFTPETVNGVYLHIHGGGFMLGRAYHNDEAHAEIAKRCCVAVISVDYRLAPENPYPAGADDCEAAAVWLAERAKSEFGSDRLLIGGESAGANLSAITLVRMRDRHGFTGFCGANLVYGAYDLSSTPSALNWGERNLILTSKLMEWFHDNYVPAAKRRDPNVSPLYADLAGMPPALFTVGTLDPLLDDSLFMHARWLAAGSRSELIVYPGGVHAFNAFPLEIARQANRRIRDFINQAIKKKN